ncbi:hypothetical protein SCP_0603840 [Sparassis crispa]|uniref:Protein CPL1-like domain-containing protein n=1 Tax=Sparassis crispa TaxID=139825 RepID=A0A401GQ93_9APHY|nr:hypothetical protein SCP_0603840 [Sparassis crispa]GBE84405.1 hypothetical protein SCP_0603840 [Sparassis crispa]
MRFTADSSSLAVYALTLLSLPAVLALPPHGIATRTRHGQTSRDILDLDTSLSLDTLGVDVALPDVDVVARRHLVDTDTSLSLDTLGIDVSIPPSNAIALRQYHARRGLSDTCAYVDLSVLSLGILPVDLNLDLCLCIGLLPSLVTLDATLEALVDLFGLDEIIAKLTVVINGCPNAQQCHYPDHSQAICTEGNPCGFQCEAPYVVEGDECVCPAPLTSCNGVCGSFPHGCGSAVPRALNARSDSRMQKRVVNADKVLTLAKAQLTCKQNETVCGVYGGSSRAFECLDVNTHVESCGGCAVPPPFLPYDASTGSDCTAIAGAESVSCVAGQCAVINCREGWEPSMAGEECIKIPRGRASPLPQATGVIAEVLRPQGYISVMDTLRAALDLGRLAGAAWDFVFVRIP